MVSRGIEGKEDRVYHMSQTILLLEVEKTIERRWKRKKQKGKWEEEGGTQQV